MLLLQTGVGDKPGHYFQVQFELKGTFDSFTEYSRVTVQPAVVRSLALSCNNLLDLELDCQCPLDRTEGTSERESRQH